MRHGESSPRNEGVKALTSGPDMRRALTQRSRSRSSHVAPSGSSLTGWRERGLVRGVWPSRWVSGRYLPRDARFSRRGIGGLAVFTFCAALQWDAGAAPSGVADRARAMIAALQANTEARELVGPTVGRAKQALSQAEAAGPAAAAALEDAALEWAEVARDLVRASEAERASDALEQEASGLATEIARLRSAVEQAMARVGRARQDLKELEGTSTHAAPRPSVAPEAPSAPARTAPPASAPAKPPAAAEKPAPSEKR